MERKLAAILAADIVGFSRLMELDEAGTLTDLKAHRKELIDPAIAEHHGRIVKLMGDGALVEFASVVDAVSCALAIQNGMANRNMEVPENKEMKFRVGVHLGDVMIEGDDIYGDGVNVAARLEGIAEPGGICISRQAYDQVETKLDLQVEDLGRQKLKNIARPVRALRVLSKDSSSLRSTTFNFWRANILSRWFWFGGVAIAFAVFVAIAVWLTASPNVQQEVGREIVPAGTPSIAVLPFTNLSGSSEQEYFADGMTDNLITDLSRFSGLFVVSRGSAFSYKGRSVNAEEVAHDLGIRFVIEGSVQRSGDRVRINAQLTDTTIARQIWAKRFDGQDADIFALQDEVTASIASQLKIELSTSERAKLKHIPTSNLEAYDYFLRAEHELLYTVSEEGTRRAVPLYRRAIKLDPNFAEAHARYARMLVDVWYLNHESIMPSPVARQLAYQTAGRALVVDPTNALAHSVLAFMQMVDGFHDKAIETARTAVALKPNDSEPLMNLALILVYSGQPDQAVPVVELALKLDPKAQPGLRLVAGIVYYSVRDYQQSIDMVLQVTKAWPTSEEAAEFLSAAYAQLERRDLAQKYRTILIDFVPTASLAWFKVAHAHYRRSEDLDHRLEGLRKAGFPEWPFGFQGMEEQRLTGKSISSWLFEKKWSGENFIGASFAQQVSNDGAFAYRSTRKDGGQGTILTGRMWLEQDQLCHKSNAYLLGRDLCGSVYRNTGKGSRGGYDYVYVSPASVNFFSVSD